MSAILSDTALVAGYDTRQTQVDIDRAERETQLLIAMDPDCPGVDPAGFVIDHLADQWANDLNINMLALQMHQSAHSKTYDKNINLSVEEIRVIAYLRQVTEGVECGFVGGDA